MEYLSDFSRDFLDTLAEYHRQIGHERASRRPSESVDDDQLRTRFMAVGPATGKFMNLLLRGFRAPRILELGTSFGYSTLWLAEAAARTGGHVMSFELYPEKSAHAGRMLAAARLADRVSLEVGDANDLLDALPGPFDFVLVDHWKSAYVESLRRFHGKLAPGAIIVSDNMRDPAIAKPWQKEYRAALAETAGLASVFLPIGSGIEVSRYAPG